MNFPPVSQSIAEIEEFRETFLAGFKEIASKGQSIYLSHLVLASIVERTLSNIHGFLLLMENKNFLCAASILRQQLDTAMRMYAFHLVDDPNLLAAHILEGARFNKFKCREGKALRDGYLKDKLSEHYQWVASVYDNTSGIVHLSSRHASATIVSTESSEEQLNSMLFKVSGLSDRPKEDFREIFRAFAESLRLTHEVSFTGIKLQ